MPKRKAPSTAWKRDAPQSFLDLVQRYEARLEQIKSCETSLGYLLSFERAGFEPKEVSHAKA